MTAAGVPERLAGLLRAGVPAIVVSVGADGFGHAAMTWAVAPGPDRVRFIADHGSTTLANLIRDGKATLQIIGPDNVIALLKGPAAPWRERLQAAPFAMAAWEMTVREVKDQAWTPVIVSPLRYEWTGPEADSLRQIERAVLVELGASID